MSFSGDVKRELSANYATTARHCRIAEFAGIFLFCAREYTKWDGKRICLVLQTENYAVAHRCASLIYKLFHYGVEIRVRQQNIKRDGRVYDLVVNDEMIVAEVLALLKQIPGGLDLGAGIDSRLIVSECCKRSFLRGAFLAAGSISDPEKFYHFEIACRSSEQAEQMLSVINSFGMDAKTITRKKYEVVYVKESEQIVDLLNIMGAHQALLVLENLRILKDMKNNINRQVNCETANLSKTISAAVEQREAIRYLDENVGLESLPENLLQVAKLRKKYPDASLKELGEMLDPPVGKSGINHRLRKIKEIAELKGWNS